MAGSKLTNYIKGYTGQQFLHDMFINLFFSSFQILSALGKQEAERRFETLLHNLSHPPSFTTVRVNTHLASVQHVKNLLFDELQKVGANFCHYVQKEISPAYAMLLLTSCGRYTVTSLQIRKLRITNVV